MGLKINLDKREEHRNKIKKNRKNFGNKVLNKTLSYLLNKPLIGGYLKKDSNNVVVSEYSIESSKIDSSLSLLFISDLHLEVVDNISNVKSLLKDQYFDFVILGGDIFDNDDVIKYKKEELENLLTFLSERTNNKIISVLGNHDGKETALVLGDKTNLLINEYYEDENIFIYGTEDPVLFYKTKDYEGDFNEDKFSLLVSHSPNFAFNVKNKYDLMLSGHTHGGQVSFFGFVPINNCKQKDMVYGKWNCNGLNGVTSSGLGCSGLPVRIGIKPEIVKVIIQKKEKSE